ncbi:Hypothetical predicted protein, partial [Pelobates cultripes]
MAIIHINYLFGELRPFLILFHYKHVKSSLSFRQFPKVRQKKDSCLQKRKRPEGELTGSTSNEKQSSPASKRRTKDADIVPGQEDDRHLDIKGREQREAFYQLL